MMSEYARSRRALGTGSDHPGVLEKGALQAAAMHPTANLHASWLRKGWNLILSWQDVEVDLRSLAGADARLMFAVETDAPLDPARGLPVWGEPHFTVSPGAPGLESSVDR